MPNGVIEAARSVAKVTWEVWVKGGVGEVIVFVPAETLGGAEAVGGEFGYSPEFFCKFPCGMVPVAVQVA